MKKILLALSISIISSLVTPMQANATVRAGNEACTQITGVIRQYQYVEAIRGFIMMFESGTVCVIIPETDNEISSLSDMLSQSSTVSAGISFNPLPATADPLDLFIRL